MNEPTLQSTGDNVPIGKTLPQIEEQLREAFKEGHRCGADACYNYLEMKEEHRQPISFVEWEEKDWKESEAKKNLGND